MGATTKISGIYCIRNIISGRLYVGSAVNIKYRWASHLSRLRRGKHHRIIQRSWDKHGEASFSFEILESVPDFNALVSREQYWIDLFDAANPRSGFNLSPTAGNSLGVKMSPESNMKKSAALKGRKRPPFSEDHKQRIRAAKIKRGGGYKLPPRTAEYKAKMSAAKIGHGGWKVRPRSAEQRANMSAAQKGKKRSIESRRKQSATMTGRKLPPFTAEHRANIAAAARARKSHKQGELSW